jgi:hypothetical protein
MNYYFIAPLPAIKKRTRISKMTSVFASLGVNIKFYGWEREKGESLSLRSDDEYSSESVILRGGGYSSVMARAMYPLWMVVVFFKTLNLGRGKTIFCLGWETAFPALIAAKITGATIIFDDADRFSLILTLPRLLSSLLHRLEYWASRKSYIHIVPGFSRYEWRNENMIPLRNTPLREDFETALGESEEIVEGFVVYINGWVGDTRGAPIFLSLADFFHSKKLSICFIVAGRVDSKSGNLLVKHPLVKYYGEVEQSHALALYKKADIVLTYYDPAVPINRKAESNKWGDCVYLGVPFIVNSEVETAREFIETGAAFSVAYGDVEGLANLICKLMDDPIILEDASKKIYSLRENYPSFDDQLKNVFKLVRER